jgi:hypothetical protein
MRVSRVEWWLRGSSLRLSDVPGLLLDARWVMLTFATRISISGLSLHAFT